MRWWFLDNKPESVCTSGQRPMNVCKKYEKNDCDGRMNINFLKKEGKSMSKSLNVKKMAFAMVFLAAGSSFALQDGQCRTPGDLLLIR